LVVTEGSQDDKEARIARSAYLTYCHRRLARLNGASFIHGMAMSDNDQHILNAIADRPSGIDAVYIGLHGGPSKTIDGIRATAQELVRTCAQKDGRPLSVKFYQSETASVWG
jgi:Domain of unknown function (DUF4917)